MKMSKGKRESVRIDGNSLRDLIKNLTKHYQDFKKEGFKEINCSFDKEYGEIEIFSNRPLTKSEERQVKKEIEERENSNLKFILNDRIKSINLRVRNYKIQLKTYRLAAESKRADKGILNTILRLETEVAYLAELKSRIQKTLKEKNKSKLNTQMKELVKVKY